MTTKKIYKINRQGGAVVIMAVIFFLVVSFMLLIAVSAPIAEQIRASKRYRDSAQSYVAAEALTDDVLYRLNSGLSVPSSLSLVVNGATSSATITDFGASKQVVSVGLENKQRRYIQSLFSQAVGASFNYGLQTGNGGFQMTGGAGIFGNVYSNGNIVGSNGTFVTGSAYSANRSDPSLNQLSSTSTATHQVEFGGQLTSGDVRPNDAAQSFQVSTSSPVVSVSLYLKKDSTAWANDITVRLMNNSGGSPGNSTLASATLLANAVPTTQSEITVAFSSPVSLTVGTTYWIVLDTANSWGNYYSWGAADAIYANGLAKRGAMGSSWSATSPATLDAFFKIYAGGDTGLIDGVTVGSSGGNAYAYRINDATISGAGLAYCKISSGSTNKSCDTSLAEPSPEAFPLTDSQVQEWKDEASAGTVRSSWNIGGSTATSTSGAMRINGDLTVGGQGTLTLGGTLYVTGNIDLGAGGNILLSTAHGTKAGVVVVDGTSDFTGGASLNGNGISGNYVLLVSTNTGCANPSSCSNNYAIDTSGSVGSVVLSAQKGGIRFTGGAQAKAAVANYIYMSGGTTLRYENGLANINFVSGPGGTWNVNGWQEVAP